MKIIKNLLNTKSIKFKVITAFGTAGLTICLIVSTTIYFANRTQKSIEETNFIYIPSVQSSLQVTNGINHSLAGLRGWMVLNKVKFKSDRQNAWKEEIKPALKSLNDLKSSWSNKKNIMMVDSINTTMKEFEIWQEKIEASANTIEDNTFALQADPTIGNMFIHISSIISEELKQPATLFRKKLMGRMALVRGTGGICGANINSLFLTGQDIYLTKLEAKWKINNENFAILEQNKSSLNSVQMKAFNQLKIEREIFNQLIEQAKLSNSTNSFNKYFISKKLLGTEAAPRARKMLSSLKKLNSNFQEDLLRTSEYSHKQITSLKKIELILLILAGIIAIGIGYFLIKGIINPINKIKDYLVELSFGRLPEALKEENSEIGDLIEASNKVSKGLRETSDFANSIGKGEYDAEYKILSEDDMLGKSLLEMRKNLKAASEEEGARAWMVQGVAQFGEILRQKNENINEFGNEIISNLVKYLKANQGAIFFIQENIEGKETLEEIGCYAYDRQKHEHKTLIKGEGLVGQAWVEKDIIFISEVPQNYVNITSGLGESTPSCLLIAPLIVNDQVYGVVELASFAVFSETEIDFVKKVGESIASTISGIKTAINTSRLLEESQQLTANMQEQEEELRQNTEEMVAQSEQVEKTLEETRTKHEETLKTIEKLKKELVEKENEITDLKSK